MDDKSISQQPYLTFFQDDTAEYDVIVDQSSSSPNLKEATWSALQPLLPLVAERMGPKEFGLMLEYSPMPESFLEKFKALQEEAAQQPPPPDPEMMKVEAMKQAKAAELEMKQQEAAVDAQITSQQTAAQIQLEREKAAAAIQLEREKAMANLMVERERMNFDQECFKSEAAMKQKALRHELVLKTGLAKVGMKKAESEGESEIMDSEDDDLDLFGNKAVSDVIAQLSQAMTILAQSQAQLAQSQAESNRMLAESMAQMGSELQAALTKPKQIVRGPDGRAIGVQ